MKLPNTKSPCANCPFRKNEPEKWLSEKRIIEISNSDSFVCHKKVRKKNVKRLQCAGHTKEDNLFYRLAKVLNLDLGLRNKELVFDSKQDCIKHHSE